MKEKVIELRKDFDDVSDDEWEKISKPFYGCLDSWLQDHRYLIDEFVALYISKGIEYNSIWSGSFEGLVNGAVETLSGYFIGKKINYDNFVNILDNKYNLRMIQEDPMIFETTKKAQD